MLQPTRCTKRLLHSIPWLTKKLKPLWSCSHHVPHAFSNMCSLIFFREVFPCLPLIFLNIFSQHVSTMFPSCSPSSAMAMAVGSNDAKRLQAIWSTWVHPGGWKSEKKHHQWPSYIDAVLIYFNMFQNWKIYGIYENLRTVHMFQYEIYGNPLKITKKNQLTSTKISGLHRPLAAWTFPWRQAQWGVRTPHRWRCGWSPAAPTHPGLGCTSNPF